MTTNKVNTIEMTRRIRDAIYEQIKDKTPAERLAFYREKAQALYDQLGIQVPTSQASQSAADHTPVLDDESQHQEL
jgi:hypothetical protein